MTAGRMAEHWVFIAALAVFGIVWGSWLNKQVKELKK